MLPPPSCRAGQRARPSAGCPLQPWQILCNTEDFCHWVVPWGLPGRRTLESGEEQCVVVWPIFNFALSASTGP